MESQLLTFGAGKRTCLGRNIATLELGKVIPANVMRFEMGLVGEGKWRVENRFVVRQEVLRVGLKRRSGR